jgi:hypothetical protein
MRLAASRFGLSYDQLHELRTRKQTDFSVVIKSRGKPPNPWKWEIYRAGHSRPVTQSLEFFSTVSAAKKAGDRACRAVRETSHFVIRDHRALGSIFCGERVWSAPFGRGFPKKRFSQKDISSCNYTQLKHLIQEAGQKRPSLIHRRHCARTWRGCVGSGKTSSPAETATRLAPSGRRDLAVAIGAKLT